MAGDPNGAGSRHRTAEVPQELQVCCFALQAAATAVTHEGTCALPQSLCTPGPGGAKSSRREIGTRIDREEKVFSDARVLEVAGAVAPLVGALVYGLDPSAMKACAPLVHRPKMILLKHLFRNFEHSEMFQNVSEWSRNP